IEITDADAFIIAPASVNSINKIACGICDTILLESFIAFDKIKLLAPAANTKMLKNSITQENLKKLKNLGVKIIRPQVKELACGIVGNGALAEPLEIAFNIIKALLKDSFFKDKSILITAGGSKEAIDSVRYISNYSSGKMGYALALCAYFLGAKTTLISPTLPFNLPLEINYKKAESSKEFLENIKNWQKDLKDSALSYLFMSAAISDYVPEKIADKKLKKQEIGKEWNLKLKQNLDILKSIEKNQNTIGFKLESSQNAESLAKTALEKKGLNAICLNRISDNFNPLDSNQNEITFITKDSSILLPLSDKITLSFKILQEVKKL
ncbi:MAG: bifunctional phosphopantothenoylcysteine decarboxylase/phosphopantothenate--cysteine ligase CoaBC, partial [Helicobacter sp.]|nr:bifunctional phosphopantothenoylcysteine decarboxylase/phosphopantothenate--cysteine ligase CoaBC [Helicobacter sp.]